MSSEREKTLEELVAAINAMERGLGFPRRRQKHPKRREILAALEMGLPSETEKRCKKATVRVCARCGQEYLGSNTRYCSKDCQAVVAREQVKQSNDRIGERRAQQRARTCAFCGVPLKSQRSTKKFCSDLCRVTSHRAKKPPRPKPELRPGQVRILGALRKAAGSVPRSWISSQTGITGRMTDYFEGLVAKGYVREIPSEEGTVCGITNKGREALARHST